MRLFFALEFSSAARQSLSALQTALRESGVRGGFTRPENLHMTLAFLGETPSPEPFASLPLRPPALPLTLTHLGLFSPGLVWAGAEKLPEALPRLCAELRALLRQSGLTLPAEPFKAHVTLCRRASLPPNFSAQRFFFPPIGLEIHRLTLFRSERPGGVLTYTPVQSWPVPRGDDPRPGAF